MAGTGAARRGAQSQTGLVPALPLDSCDPGQGRGIWTVKAHPCCEDRTVGPDTEGLSAGPRALLLDASTPAAPRSPERQPSRPPVASAPTHLAALDHPQGAEAQGAASVLQGSLRVFCCDLCRGWIPGSGPPLRELPGEPGKAADAHFWEEMDRRSSRGSLGRRKVSCRPHPARVSPYRGQGAEPQHEGQGQGLRVQHADVHAVPQGGHQGSTPSLHRGGPAHPARGGRCRR